MMIRKAAQKDDDILVRHYRAIWESYGVDDVNIRPDAEAPPIARRQEWKPRCVRPWPKVLGHYAQRASRLWCWQLSLPPEKLKLLKHYYANPNWKLT